MSTRARIGLKLEDESIISVYHHWDGYPEWLGITLKEHYNTKEKIAELIDGGNMSSATQIMYMTTKNKSLLNVTHNPHTMVGMMKHLD